MPPDRPPRSISSIPATTWRCRPRSDRRCQSNRAPRGQRRFRSLLRRSALKAQRREQLWHGSVSPKRLGSWGSESECGSSEFHGGGDLDRCDARHPRLRMLRRNLEGADIPSSLGHEARGRRRGGVANGEIGRHGGGRW
ncbi:hypothetical protein NL676_008031 [Syzygium grande]|nr:hypothetical protein NL676_008031 [Syzygium grande]